MRPRFFGLEVTGLKQQLDNRVVFGEAFQFAGGRRGAGAPSGAQQVAAAVAHVGDQRPLLADQHQHDRGTHAVQSRLALRLRAQRVTDFRQRRTDALTSLGAGQIPAALHSFL